MGLSALDRYPGSLDDIDFDFIQTEQSSERGKACGNPDAFLHDEDFQLSARRYVRTGREHLISREKCFANFSVVKLLVGGSS